VHRYGYVQQAVREWTYDIHSLALAATKAPFLGEQKKAVT
jgi:hypothetical protein